LKLELAAVVDAGESLVKKTYILEGDGPIAFQAYELISTVIASIETANFPSLVAVARQKSDGMANCQAQLVPYGRSCVQPGLQYLLKNFQKPLNQSLILLKCEGFSVYTKYKN
jgi:hypothetical protein